MIMNKPRSQVETKSRSVVNKFNTAESKSSMVANYQHKAVYSGIKEKYNIESQVDMQMTEKTETVRLRQEMNIFDRKQEVKPDLNKSLESPNEPTES